MEGTEEDEEIIEDFVNHENLLSDSSFDYMEEMQETNIQGVHKIKNFTD